MLNTPKGHTIQTVATGEGFHLATLTIRLHGLRAPFLILCSVRDAPFFPVSGALLKSPSVSVPAFPGFGRCRDTLVHTWAPPPFVFSPRISSVTAHSSLNASGFRGYSIWVSQICPLLLPPSRVWFLEFRPLILNPNIHRRLVVSSNLFIFRPARFRSVSVPCNVESMRFRTEPSYSSVAVNVRSMCPIFRRVFSLVPVSDPAPVSFQLFLLIIRFVVSNCIVPAFMPCSSVVRIKSLCFSVSSVSQ